MRIDGRLIATNIKDQLKIEVGRTKEKGVTPHLAVVLIGNDPASETYVTQKKKAAEEIGVIVTVYNLASSTQLFELKKLLFSLNSDPTVHGIIVQRPLSGMDITDDQVDLLVVPQKDVDGFHPESKFTPPVANAILKILNWVAVDVTSNPTSPLKQNFAEAFPTWLSKQRILVIGRGVTAGKPIADALKNQGAHVDIAYSTTKYMDALLRSAQIIISCVGKSNVVRHQDITQKSIVIGVGLHQERGRLATDYNQEEIEKVAAYFTPVPGGVGPVNVACLFENLLAAIHNPSTSAK
jgi:methylenetetrahydrofolate dehydrogenase (NADP+)/methenyltetrahydrofolate cyclohydrolase